MGSQLSVFGTHSNESPSNDSITKTNPQTNTSKNNSTMSIAVDDTNISYQWTINDFFEILHSRRRKIDLKSPSFRVLDYPNILFNMRLVLRMDSSGNISHWGLFLKASKSFFYDEVTINISHKFKLTSPRSDLVSWNSNLLESVFHLEKWKRNQWSVENCIPIHAIKETLRSFGMLNVVCEIMHKENGDGFIYRSIINQKLKSFISNYERYNAQLYEMYTSTSTSDCTIVHRGKVFWVHKFIVMAQSLVLKERFMDENSEESKGNCVIINEAVGISAVKMLVDYLYKARLPSDINRREIDELLHLADTYKINNLKLLCQEMLNFQLTSEITQRGAK
uniref:Speckle-type POZ protein (inferred by orthology to a human protein) n=1 Tax=Strongyloides venezuelensis TaxID=75913 RepID=A0A0K0G2Y0_STRVS